MKRIQLALLVSLACAASSCGVGYNRMLFFTKTNAGVDLDALPTTAEVTIARREGVVEPTFEGGQTLPVLASFTSDNNAGGRLFGGVGMTFATGEAAVAIAKYHGEGDVEGNEADTFLSAKEDAVRVGTEPKGKGWFGNEEALLYEPGTMAPLVFGTDSSLGLKAVADGQGPTGASVAFGFRRKELAWSPIVMEETQSTDGNGTDYEIRTPSLIATLDAAYEGQAGTSGAEADLKYVQYFATGKAASYLALKRDVREPVLARIIPETELGALDLQKENQRLATQLYENVQGFVVPDDPALFQHEDDPQGVLDQVRGEMQTLFQGVHNTAVALNYLDSPIQDFDKLEPEEARDKLAAELKGVATSMDDNTGLMKNVLESLIALSNSSVY